MTEFLKLLVVIAMYAILCLILASLIALLLILPGNAILSAFDMQAQGFLTYFYFGIVVVVIKSFF